MDNLVACEYRRGGRSVSRVHRRGDSARPRDQAATGSSTSRDTRPGDHVGWALGCSPAYRKCAAAQRMLGVFRLFAGHVLKSLNDAPLPERPLSGFVMLGASVRELRTPTLRHKFSRRCSSLAETIGIGATSLNTPRSPSPDTRQSA